MTLRVPSWFQGSLTFLETHLIYWVILVGLIFEFRYLLHKNRRCVIAMSRLGTASRQTQPVFFYSLWVLHLAAASFFSLMFIGYLSDLL